MDSSALLLFFAALACSTDAKLTWNAPVKVNGGIATCAASIPAGATKFKTPLTITATSSDVNATVTYSIAPSQDPFTVNDKNGTITLSAVLDYATTATHTVNITATETLQNKSTGSTATVTLTVTVVYPKPFSKTDESVCFADGTTADTVVDTLPNATSADTYTITEGDTTSTFKVDANKILVKKPLNKTASPYTLTVKANGKPDDLTLTVTVGDCSAASLLAPLGLLTLLMALISTVN